MHNYSQKEKRSKKERERRGTDYLSPKNYNPEYWKPCKGCPEGHSSYWKTIVESPQWKAWEEEVARRVHKQQNWKKMIGVFDVDECRECGFISQQHFQEFLKYCKNVYI